MRKIFEPKKFLTSEDRKELKKIIKSPYLYKKDTLQQVEQVIEQLEITQTDITKDYQDWVKVGFALASAFGEQGASLFHRVSRLYPDYQYESCQKQYEKCSQSHQEGITIKTFFFLAKQHGITQSSMAEKAMPRLQTTKKKAAETETIAKEKEVIIPEFPDEIFEYLPSYLQQITKCAENNKERDILLLGALTTLSACLPNVQGIYDKAIVYPNLFLFITAPASSGKGKVNLCRRLVEPIHQQKREATKTEKMQYQVELSLYLEQKKKDQTMIKPDMPPEQLVFIPANSSATGTFELLENNQGEGLIFETEGDTLAQTFKSEYGNYSDGFRKAFHHETISYYRRTQREYVHIDLPKLSAVLTGTPDQVLALMPDSENGLFSRFIFYKMQRQKQWKNVFDNSQKESLDCIFDSFGKQFLEYYTILSQQPEGITVQLQKEQIKKFNDFFSKQYDMFLFLKKRGLEASLFRMGLICYRFTMIFSVLRMLDNGIVKHRIECLDQDFEVAFRMAKLLLQHTEIVFSYLPPKPSITPKSKNKKELFLEELPLQFSTQDFKKIAQSLDIPEKSAERYVKEFIGKGMITRKSQGNYLHNLKNAKKAS